MKISWSIFPKFFKHLSVPELAQLVRDVGLDTTNAVVRDGFWVSRESFAADLPLFVKQMSDEGLTVSFATAGFMPGEILADESLLATLTDSGVAEFRMGYFSWDKSKTPGACADDARRQLEQIVPLLQKHNVRAVYQVHYGRLLPSAWSTWPVVRDLPPEHIGIMLDPGNQLNEGWERWRPAAALLGNSLVAMGIKDGIQHLDTGKFEWVPCGQGTVDWPEVARAVKAVDFDGTFVFMPFYNDDDPDTMKARLKDEVAFLRDVFAQVEAGD